MQPLIIANWKANKTIEEAVDFAKGLGEAIEQSSANVVVCPPFTALSTIASLADQYRFKVGAQNISRFQDGAYTGEVTARMVKELVDHCIVGHSERRRYFGETDETVMEKVDHLLEVGITPILCVSDKVQLDSYLKTEGNIIKMAEKIIFVYEPPSAISGGGDYRAEDSASADHQCQLIKEKIGKSIVVLYGGSVNPDNIKSFLEMPNISGALVGQASLSIESFSTLIGSSI